MPSDRMMPTLRSIVRDVAPRAAIVELRTLAALEEEGLIAQPHTGAGRVPTDHGYRFFVDSLLQLNDPSPKERKAIEDGMRTGDIFTNAPGTNLVNTAEMGAAIIARL